MSPTVGYAGMTHLGLCSAAAAAAKGFSVLAFDPDPALVARLAARDLCVREPQLVELLAVHGGRIAFTADPDTLRRCDLVYVAQDVATDACGGSDLVAVSALIKRVASAARDDAVVVVLSQVPPGFTRAHQQADRPLYYQVETLVFGRAVERALSPERIIIGSPDPAAPLPKAFAAFLAAFACPVLPMRLESAECAKIAVNCCLAASIATADTLAELCERIGADWSEIAPALRLDRRIGRFAYLTPGLGIAGGNIERDLATVVSLSGEHGTEAGIIRAIVANGRHRRDWPLRTLHAELLARAPDAEIAVLGLAYKENTDSVKNAPAVDLIRHLTRWPLRVYDPVVPVSAAPHPSVIAARSALDAAAGADALAIMTPWPEFRELAPVALATIMRGKLVLDPYGVLDGGAAADAGLDYRTLGRTRVC
ncbi:MAG TPA: nucleotide sugar dehydrogenase [Hyphomicrobiaceae bacterium]|nr:nucleotide sugar dehydrogenase [Hyphomicrobiaceae bacterium]